MKVLATNKKAHFDYNLGKTYTAGLVLTGSETKSAKGGGSNLKNSYVIFKHDEAFVLGLHIRAYKPANEKEYDPDKTRKLLLNKKEINKLIQANDEPGASIVVTRLILSDRGLLKLEISEAKGKKEFEKRQKIKERDIKRENRGKFTSI